MAVLFNVFKKRSLFAGCVLHAFWAKVLLSINKLYHFSCRGDRAVMCRSRNDSTVGQKTTGGAWRHMGSNPIPGAILPVNLLANQS